MNNGIQTIVPKTSYLTFADYWLQACFGDKLDLSGSLITRKFFSLHICDDWGAGHLLCLPQQSERRGDTNKIGKKFFITISQVISWADFLNRRSREVMPFLFIIFLLIFFLAADDII